jgi:broad specificity phosphatase PhoE
MQFYFARHGESEANVLHEFSNRGLKHPLTARGREQVAALAAHLREVDVRAIYSSPVLRAQQSAEILSERLGVDWEVAPALVEYDVGDLEGRSDAAAWQLYDEIWTDWTVQGNRSRRFPGGESFDGIAERFMPFVAELRARYRDSSGVLLLIGHGGTFYCMLPQLLTNVDFAFVKTHPLANTDYVLAGEQGDDLVCVQWAGHTF